MRVDNILEDVDDGVEDRHTIARDIVNVRHTSDRLQALEHHIRVHLVGAVKQRHNKWHNKVQMVVEVRAKDAERAADPDRVRILEGEDSEDARDKATQRTGKLVTEHETNLLKQCNELIDEALNVPVFLHSVRWGRATDIYATSMSLMNWSR